MREFRLSEEQQSVPLEPPSLTAVQLHRPEVRTEPDEVLQGDPLCHWCKVRPATTADHLIGAPNGTHDLSNLVPVCADCNRLRGASRGGQVAKAKRQERDIPDAWKKEER